MVDPSLRRAPGRPESGADLFDQLKALGSSFGGGCGYPVIVSASNISLRRSNLDLISIKVAKLTNLIRNWPYGLKVTNHKDDDTN